MSILALDVGVKRIGAAIEKNGVVFEYATFINAEEFKKKLQNIIEQESIVRIIIGLPKTLKGEKGFQAQHVEKFVDSLELTIPIEYIDERFSSVAARKGLEALGLSREKIEERIDSFSAKILLEDYIQNQS